jgi:hypothetical protein
MADSGNAKICFGHPRPTAAFVMFFNGDRVTLKVFIILEDFFNARGTAAESECD